MSSLLTNAAGMTALQTLKNINKNLDTTQGRISTGLRVGEASHNAAYWSIATTMRSDNKAMGTVQDALGLGAAQIDVAYTAMDSVKEALDEIKKKLVAASQPGVDKAKVQSEISQLTSSIRSISDSASFSGGNWLSVDSNSGEYAATQKVVASFTRGEGGVVTLGTIDVDVEGMALFDANGIGMLERVGDPNTNAGGLMNFDPTTPSDTATMLAFGDDPIVLGEYDKITFEISVDGGDAIKITIDKATVDAALEIDTGEIADETEFLTVVTRALGNQNLNVGDGTSGELIDLALGGANSDQLEFTSNDLGGGGGTIVISNVRLSAGGSDLDLETLDITNMSVEDLGDAIQGIDRMLGSVTTAASDLGAIKHRIDTQKDFVGKLMDAVDRGVGQLVDADMAKESTRLQALQVQQQLGIQALSIANGNTQSILSLFR